MYLISYQSLGFGESAFLKGDGQARSLTQGKTGSSVIDHFCNTYDTLAQRETTVSSSWWGTKYPSVHLSTWGAVELCVVDRVVEVLRAGTRRAHILVSDQPNTEHSLTKETTNIVE